MVVIIGKEEHSISRRNKLLPKLGKEVPPSVEFIKLWTFYLYSVLDLRTNRLVYPWYVMLCYVMLCWQVWSGKEVNYALGAPYFRTVSMSWATECHVEVLQTTASCMRATPEPFLHDPIMDFIIFGSLAVERLSKAL